MRKFYLLALLICSIFTFGQIKEVAKKVQNLNAKNQAFVKYDLFTKNSDVQKTSKYLTSASDVTVLNLNVSELNKVLKNSPEYISISIPYQNDEVEVQLYKTNVVSDGFVAKDEKGNILDYQLGEYYRGIVRGDYYSVAAISFFDGDVMGVISNDQYGNIVLGKSVDKTDFVSYSDKNLLGQNPFVCGVDELEYNKNIEHTISYDPDMHFAPNTEKCVKIYYEIAYRPYQLNGSNIQNTINWITGIQNNIGTLYTNDNVNVALHSIKIWTVDDPYNGNYEENLYMFRNTVTDFVGDLAHLVNYPSTTSVAFLNSLCTTNNYAYSGISMSYAQVPTYSWTIMAMTHEMGHALGSPHTHACAWNGNNTKIDGCGPAGGVPDNSYGTCPNAPIPPTGGTIMSYCHLVSAGINFNNGFGDQPGALIRSTVDSKACLGTDCSCMNTLMGIQVSYSQNGSIQAQIEDSGSSEWKYQILPFGQNPGDNWQTTTSTSIDISGLVDHQYYVIYVTNICASGAEGGLMTQIIIPGNFCDGTIFTDTGGLNGTYGPNQYYEKTFYPSSPGEKVRLNFIRIGVRENDDFMYVHNGPSSSSPLFENGTITGVNFPGPSFTSTDESGAITIRFASNGVNFMYGWEAEVNCAALGIEDMSDSYGVLVYPNPATDILNISSQRSPIKSVKLNDVSGKLISNEKVSYNNGTLKIGHLPKGVYILTLTVGDKEITKKIIKN